MEKRINNDLAQAIKEQNAVKCTALREIKTAIMNFKTSAAKTCAYFINHKVIANNRSF